MTDIRLVDEASDVASALGTVADDVVGVDVERADSDRYHRQAALVQVGDAGHCVLIDPLAIDDLTDLDRFLAGRTTVLHAVENDIVPLDSLDVHPPEIADTAVAAAVLGLPTGLGPLLEEVLGIELTMDKGRYQRADWEARPLDDGMMRYAAGDVFHLPALWRDLAERLDRADRTSWYEQELAATIANARADTRDWTRTKGAGRLDPPQRAILRALWEEREAVAREHDIAPNRLLHDRTIVSLAEQPARDVRELVARNKRRNSPLADHAEAILAAQRRGMDAEPEPKPAGSRRWVDADRDAYDRMRRRRAEIAEELGIDAGVLCPSRPLWAAVASEPTDPDALVTAAELRPWQAELLRDELWRIYLESRDEAGADA